MARSARVIKLVGVRGQRTTRLRRSERLMTKKQRRCSHTDDDEEDQGGICCVRMGAVTLENRWGTEEAYSVSCLEEKEPRRKKGQVRTPRKRRV